MSQKQRNIRSSGSGASYTYVSKTAPERLIAMVYFDGRTPDNEIVEDGVKYERVELVLNWDSLPKNARNNITRSAYKAFTRFMERPDAQAILDATEERLRREGSNLLDRFTNQKCTRAK